MATKRMLQLSEQIKECLALMLARGEVSDPRVSGVTLSAVKMTPDLQIAKVYFSVLGDQDKQKSVAIGLKQATGYLRRKLGEELQIRFTPHLVFYYDDSAEYSVKMGSLLSKVSEDLHENSTDENEIPSGEDDK